MTRVALFREGADSATTFRAVSARTQTTGRTPGEALDALTSQLGEDDLGTLIIVRGLRADQFFDETQRERLKQLMAQWRQARDSGLTLSADEQSELERLIDAEVLAAAQRTEALRRELAT